MCQLTFVDTKQADNVPQDLIRLLIISNALEGHLDGFGYYLFDNNVINKSEVDAVKWFADKKNRDNWNNIDNPVGMYHVRRASKLTKNIKQEHAHPFYENSTVLAHNGTLDLKYSDAKFKNLWKDDGDNIIDSQKFLRVLNDLRGQNILKPEHIRDAVNKFTGSFALLIYDTKVKDNLWVARGKSKTLFKLTIMRNKHPVAVVLNTKHYMLRYFLEVLATFAPRNRGLSFDLEELEENHIYQYTLGSFNFEKVMDVRETEKSQTTVVYKYPREDDDIKYIPKNVETQKPAVESTVQSNIIDLMYTLGLTFAEIVLMYEAVYYDNIFTATEDELDHFENILITMNSKFNFTGRQKIWRENCMKFYPYKPKIAIYEKLGIKFPFMFNTKAELESAFENCDDCEVKEVK